MSTRAFTRFVFSPSVNLDLPLMIESIGYNPKQERITRPNGYPYYHWLQTEEGEGKLTYGAETVLLSQSTGVLLPPGMPHAYEATQSSGWETYYLTFGGAAAVPILLAYDIQAPSVFRWDTEAPVSPMLGEMLKKVSSGMDLFGLETSTDAYRFLGILSKFGQASNMSVSKNMQKLTPLLQWMEQAYSNPDIGLDNLADVLGMSGRHLSKLFQQTFGLAPYAYLTQMRIHKAKEQLADEPGVTVSTIAGRTGFRDASHFVATFRKHTGMTPQQFRSLH